MEFLRRQNHVVDFPPELPFEFLNCFCKDIPLWHADHNYIEIAGGILLVSRERTVQIRLRDSFNFLEGLRDQRHSSNGLGDDATHLMEKGIFPVEPEILLAPAFSRETAGILFDPESSHTGENASARFESWQDIAAHFEAIWMTGR